MAPASVADLLEFWDDKLVSEGSELIARRMLLMSRLSTFAAEMYGDLSGGRETLSVAYCPNVGSVPTVDDIPAAFRFGYSPRHAGRSING